MALKKKGRSAPQPIYSVHDVFTPTRPAASLNYVARPAIDDRLVDALRTPGKQVIVYGESGSGKSTLLRNKLQEVYEAHIKTQCSAAMSYNQLILDAFDQLDRYYVRTTNAQSSRRISSSVGADIKAIKFELAADRARGTGQVMERLLPPQLSPQRLAALFGELRMCWLIEDFHKIREHEKVLFAHSLKIFSDMSDTYPDVKSARIAVDSATRQLGWPTVASEGVGVLADRVRLGRTSRNPISIWTKLYRHHRKVADELRQVQLRPGSHPKEDPWAIDERPTMNLKTTPGLVFFDDPPLPPRPEPTGYAQGNYRPCDCDSGQKWKFCCQGLSRG